MEQNKIPQDKAKSLLLKLVKAIQYKEKMFQEQEKVREKTPTVMSTKKHQTNFYNI